MSPLPRSRHDALRRDAFLGVESSALRRRWEARLTAAEDLNALAIAQRTGLSPIVSRILAARGAAVEEAESFLNPRLRDLMPDPARITDCEAAADRLATAVRRGENVAVFGDYDVDGAASTALVCGLLQKLGCRVETYIPDRIVEGYGPNPPAVRGLCERGATLIVTVDCGTMSHEAVDAARAAGADVVVIDHHQTGPELPAATALVNPNRQDDLSGLGHLCATGVAFMVAVALRRKLARPDFPDLMGMLDIVALATVCDMVPLRTLNRAFVVQGLTVANRGKNAGLVALAQVARVQGKLGANECAFYLGPRINAGGRVGDAGLGVRLLLETDPGKAEDIAIRLERHNKERQAIEAEALRDALAEVEAERAGGAGGIIVSARDGWHPGVVGLVASRLKERFGSPAFAIGFDGSGRGSGSGRSVPSLDLGAVVRRAVESGILVKGGGHAMAAGLTIMKDRLGDFRAFIEEQVAHSDEAPVLQIDAAVTSGGASVELLDSVERAGPYGVGHARPVFALADQTVVDARVVGAGHVAVRLRGPEGFGCKGIAFRAAESPVGEQLRAGAGHRMHLAGTLARDDYRGQRGTVFRIEDVARVE